MLHISQLQTGLLLFLIGLVLWTIGGMISFVTRYDVHNRMLRADFDPKRPAREERGTSKEIWDAYFNNPKSRWWCRLGYSICALGMLVLVFGDKTS